MFEAKPAISLTNGAFSLLPPPPSFSLFFFLIKNVGGSGGGSIIEPVVEELEPRPLHH